MNVGLVVWTEIGKMTTITTNHRGFIWVEVQLKSNAG